MKKIITLLTFTLSFSIAILNAQTKTASKLGTSSKMSHNDSLMCGKEWHVISVEEQGEKTKPKEKNQNDLLFMTLDGTYYAILSAVKNAGSWTRAGQFIYLTDNTSGQKFSYKVLSIDKKRLKIEYRDSNGVPLILEMK